MAHFFPSPQHQLGVNNNAARAAKGNVTKKEKYEDKVIWKAHVLDSILFAWKMNIGPESPQHFRLGQNNCMTCDVA